MLTRHCLSGGSVQVGLYEMIKTIFYKKTAAVPCAHHDHRSRLNRRKDILCTPCSNDTLNQRANVLLPICREDETQYRELISVDGRG